MLALLADARTRFSRTSPAKARFWHLGGAEDPMHSWFTLSAIVTVSLLAVAQTRPSDVNSSGADTVRTERLATLEFPWGMAYLPDGRLLITEKPGRLRIFANGQLSAPIENVPAVAY